MKRHFVLASLCLSIFLTGVVRSARAGDGAKLCAVIFSVKPATRPTAELERSFAESWERLLVAKGDSIAGVIDAHLEVAEELLNARGVATERVVFRGQRALRILTETWPGPDLNPLTRVSRGLGRVLQTSLVYVPGELLRSRAQGIFFSAERTIALDRLSLWSARVSDVLLHEISHAYRHAVEGEVNSVFSGERADSGYPDENSYDRYMRFDEILAVAKQGAVIARDFARNVARKTKAEARSEAKDYFRRLKARRANLQGHLERLRKSQAAFERAQLALLSVVDRGGQSLLVRSYSRYLSWGGSALVEFPEADLMRIQIGEGPGVVNTVFVRLQPESIRVFSEVFKANAERLAPRNAAAEVLRLLTNSNRRRAQLIAKLAGALVDGQIVNLDDPARNYDQADELVREFDRYRDLATEFAWKSVLELN